jgi:hypothetical protein
MALPLQPQKPHHHHHHHHRHQQQQQQQQQDVADEAGIGRLSARPAGSRAHLCASCQMPVATWGHLHPCKHAFCLQCASAMPRCIV